MNGGRGGSAGMARAKKTPSFRLRDSTGDHAEQRFQFSDPSGVVWEVAPSDDGFGFDLRNQIGDNIVVISHVANRVQVSTIREGLLVIGGPGLPASEVK